jgi:hypothetical protein
MAWLIAASSTSGLQTVVTWGALVTMIGQKWVANRRGAQLRNPELGKTYPKLQHRILAAIEGSAAVGVALQALMLAAPGGGAVEPAVKGSIAAITLLMAERARRYEAQRTSETEPKGKLPAVNVNATKKLLGMLALGGLANIVFAVVNLYLAHEYMEDAADAVKSAEAALKAAQDALDAAKADLTQKQDVLKQVDKDLADAEDVLKKASDAEKAEAQKKRDDAKSKRDAAERAVNDAYSVRSDAQAKAEKTQGDLETAQKKFDAAKKKFDNMPHF